MPQDVYLRLSAGDVWLRPDAADAPSNIIPGVGLAIGLGVALAIAGTAGVDLTPTLYVRRSRRWGRVRFVR